MSASLPLGRIRERLWVSSCQIANKGMVTFFQVLCCVVLIMSPFFFLVTHGTRPKQWQFL